MVSSGPATALGPRHAAQVLLSLAAVAMLSIGQTDGSRQDPNGSAGRTLSQLASPAIDDGWYDAFHNYDEIVKRMKQLAQANDRWVSVHTMDIKTVEGRSIWYMKISVRPGIRRRVVLVGLQHAREWVAASATMMAAEKLVAGIGSSAAIDALLAKLEVIIVPVLNPDGLEFTFSPNGGTCAYYMAAQSQCDRMWRKNRQELGGSTQCVGIDLNRAWPLDWGARGGEGLSPSNPCAEDYPGDYPLQPPEAMALCRLLAELHGVDPTVLCSTTGGAKAAAVWGEQGKLPKEGVVGFLDIHSYGQMILGCWAHVNSPSYNRVVMDGIGNMMKEAVNAGCQSSACKWDYGIGDLNGDIYLTSGVLPDWTFWALGAASYTLELPPKTWSAGGFAPSSTKIEEYASATFPAVIALMTGVLKDWELHNPVEEAVASPQCPEGTDVHTLEVRNRLDYYPRELSWELQTATREALAGWSQGPGGLRAEDSATGGIIKLCSGTYIIIYRDSAGDGICCSEGVGDLSVIADGIQMYHGDGAFGTELILAAALGEHSVVRQIDSSAYNTAQATQEAFVLAGPGISAQGSAIAGDDAGPDAGGPPRAVVIAVAAPAACVLVVALSAAGYLMWRRRRGQQHRPLAASASSSHRTSGRCLLGMNLSSSDVLQPSAPDRSPDIPLQPEGSIQLQPLASPHR